MLAIINVCLCELECNEQIGLFAVVCLLFDEWINLIQDIESINEFTNQTTTSQFTEGRSEVWWLKADWSQKTSSTKARKEKWMRWNKQWTEIKAQIEWLEMQFKLMLAVNSQFGLLLLKIAAEFIKLKLNSLPEVNWIEVWMKLQSNKQTKWN